MKIIKQLLKPWFHIILTKSNENNLQAEIVILFENNL